MKFIRHYYHVWTYGAWAEPAREHFTALKAAGFQGHVTVSLVGDRRDRDYARGMISSLYYGVNDWIGNDAGFEQMTLREIHQFVHQAPGEIAIFYAHTKGAFHPTEWNRTWRHAMTDRLVTGWRTATSQLATGYDTAGCFWLTPERNAVPARYGGGPGRIDSPVYAGNFWWANASYLRKLPPVAMTSRGDAEKWIGLANPRAAELHPGWPGVNDMRVRMVQHLSGMRPDGREWPQPGEEFEVPGDEGFYLTRTTPSHPEPIAQFVEQHDNREI